MVIQTWLWRSFGLNVQLNKIFLLTVSFNDMKLQPKIKRRLETSIFEATITDKGKQWNG